MKPKNPMSRRACHGDRQPLDCADGCGAVRGVLVLAGLLDRAADLGSQGRFDLLPVPWAKPALAARVTRMIQCELEEKHLIEHPSCPAPEDPEDHAALMRGIGLRAWLLTDAVHPGIRNLLEKGWSVRRHKLAAKEVDYLSLHGNDITFRWPCLVANDQAAIEQFESLLLTRLQNSG